MLTQVDHPRERNGVNFCSKNWIQKWLATPPKQRWGNTPTAIQKQFSGYLATEQHKRQGNKFKFQPNDYKKINPSWWNFLDSC